MGRTGIMGAGLLAAFAAPGAALAAPAFSCAGFALAGGAEILCSHVDPVASAQTCTYSWTLAGAGGAPDVVQGTFVLRPGQQNVAVYQGTGFSNALAIPVVLCQGPTGGRP